MLLKGYPFELSIGTKFWKGPITVPTEPFYPEVRKSAMLHVENNFEGSNAKLKCIAQGLPHPEVRNFGIIH